MDKEEKLIIILENVLAQVNRITAYHRHGGDIPKEHLDTLSNYQIRAEQELEEIKNDNKTDLPKV